MKNITSKFTFLILLFSSLLFIQCENSESFDNQSQTKLISPEGFKIANSISGLKKQYDIPENLEVLKIEYTESETYNSALITYKNEDGTENNVAVVKGIFNIEASLMETETPNLSKSGGDETIWVVSCSGCENCGVSFTIGEENQVTYRCGSGQTCCVMSVKKTTTLDPG